MNSFRKIDKEAEVCVSSTSMTETDKMRIWENRTALMNNLGIDKVLDELTQRKVLTIHENHLIKQTKNRKEQTQSLFDLLEQKGGHSFEMFVSAVRTCHPALDELLKSDIYQNNPRLLSLSPDATIYSFEKKDREPPNEPEEENRRLRFENFELKKKIKEIIEVNVRWQGYKEQSDDYIRCLMQKLEAVESPDVKNTSNDEQQRTTETLVHKWKEKVQFTEEANKKLQNECKQLKHQLEESKCEIKNSETIIRLLQEELHEQHARRQPVHVTVDDKEEIAILQQQLQCYKQDFEQERRDKQKAEIRQQELEHRLLLIKENPERQQKTKPTYQDPRDLDFIEEFHKHENFRHGHMPERPQETIGAFQEHRDLGFIHEFNKHDNFAYEDGSHVIRRSIYQADDGEDETDGQTVVQAYSSSTLEDETNPHDYHEFTKELKYIQAESESD